MRASRYSGWAAESGPDLPGRGPIVGSQQRVRTPIAPHHGATEEAGFRSEQVGDQSGDFFRPARTADRNGEGVEERCELGIAPLRPGPSFPRGSEMIDCTALRRPWDGLRSRRPCPRHCPSRRSISWRPLAVAATIPGGGGHLGRRDGLGVCDQSWVRGWRPRTPRLIRTWEPAEESGFHAPDEGVHLCPPKATTGIRY
jgi:hypothetical protein